VDGVGLFNRDKGLPRMRTIFNSFGQLKSRKSFQREIAPGVTIRVTKPSRSLSLGRSKPVIGLSDRFHAAWNVLRGKAHATPSPIQQRLRRAA
jgi:hypothetical protein